MFIESKVVKSKLGNNIDFFVNAEHNSVLVVGCFHGDEPQGDFLIRKYIQKNPDTKLIMMPCLNPDGVKQHTRVNANGVDLNRNFPTKNWELSSCKDDYYSGEYPKSEIETKFLIDVIEKYLPKIILTLHAPYKIVNYDGDAKDIAEKISEIIKYPTEKDIGYPTPGSFGTWAGIEKKIPVITLELDENTDIKNLEKPVFEIFRMLEDY